MLQVARRREGFLPVQPGARVHPLLACTPALPPCLQANLQALKYASPLDLLAHVNLVGAWLIVSGL